MRQYTFNDLKNHYPFKENVQRTNLPGYNNSEFQVVSFIIGHEASFKC